VSLFLILPAAKARAAQFLSPLDGQPFVVLFPGASILERRWGADRFGQVAASHPHPEVQINNL